MPRGVFSPVSPFYESFSLHNCERFMLFLLNFPVLEHFGVPFLKNYDIFKIQYSICIVFSEVNYGNLFLKKKKFAETKVPKFKLNISI